MRMMNCNGAIDVSLGYKTYKILVQPGYLEINVSQSLRL